MFSIVGGSALLPDDLFGAGTTAIDGYNLYIGVMIMMLVGFGYLMTFMRYYGLGAVGFCLLVTAVGMQWGLLVENFFEMWWHGEFKEVWLYSCYWRICSYKLCFIHSIVT